MKRGFTILELLVATLLLGMLVSILTMLFNQSSISWRTGLAGVADLDKVRQNMAELRDEADNAYAWENKVHRILGLWDDQGRLRTRAWNVGSEQGGANDAGFLQSKCGSVGRTDAKLSDFKTTPVGSGDAGGGIRTYTVNVKCDGPDGEPDTWDDIWSYPDEIN
ncbi:MAG: prepilin-type N-terminal cleavage/methylation domain-containing protein [Kiritimatiellae bacterium]|nr:prepilin-type N-terminal cleavage/methylation domain-containing protein [Kiritimatiellia bacterium]